MRFYHKITLALAVICLFGDSGLGAPTEGRYMYVKCNPDDKNANCVTHKGPLVPLEGKSSRLPASAVKDIFPVTTEEAVPEMEEQSGSGDSDTFAPFINTDELMRDAPEKEADKDEEEGSTVEEIDYSENVSRQKIDWLSEKDLKEENIIA
ncbi:serglycin [Garra rufa]|uniref:serglycin n=1 Tax=Garra rufa TaxID=137080 RepID=UPI003CCEEE24